MTVVACDTEETWYEIKNLWRDRGTERLYVTDGKRVGHVSYVGVHELGDATKIENGKPINEFKGHDAIVLHVGWFQDGYGPEIKGDGA